MKLIVKLGVIVIVALVLGASAYVVFFSGGGTNGGNNDDHQQNENDTQPPTITSVTGNVTVIAGQSITISAVFSDNVGVTEATLYYKTANASTWDPVSILSGSVSLSIPATATENYFYYVTVNDAAGNGPVGDPSTDGSTYYIITVQPSGGDHGNETLTHTVFIEEATATWCSNCPNVANILYSLYNSNKYNFYYVALINKSNSDTTKRLWNDYNIHGFPTVFFDGGYKVTLGANTPESAYIDAINAAQSRPEIPKIKVTITAQNTTNEVTISTLIENRGNTTYTGRLKLYLTEIISHEIDYNNEPYHFGFLGYITDTNVSVDENQNIHLNVTKNISGYDYENLMVMGVLFSSEKNTGYSDPPTDKYPFDAYYADAANATKVVPKGNLPPQLQITSPLKGNIYWNGKALPIVEKIIERKHILKIKKLENLSLLKDFLYNKTYLLGNKKVITVDATDDSAVAKVEFYVDGTLQLTDTQAPYEWSFTKISTLKSIFFKSHTLKVIVYDDTGKTTSASLIFKARI